MLCLLLLLVVCMVLLISQLHQVQSHFTSGKLNPCAGSTISGIYSFRLVFSHLALRTTENWLHLSNRALESWEMEERLRVSLTWFWTFGHQALDSNELNWSSQHYTPDLNSDSIILLELWIYWYYDSGSCETDISCIPVCILLVHS